MRKIVLLTFVFFVILSFPVKAEMSADNISLYEKVLKDVTEILSKNKRKRVDLDKPYVSFKMGHSNFDTNGYFAGEKIANAGSFFSLSVGKNFRFFRPEFEFIYSFVESSVISKETNLRYVSLNNVLPLAYSSTDYVDYSAKVNNTLFMMNFLFDISTGTYFTPYLGMGVGVAYNKLKLSEEKVDIFNVGNGDVEYSESFDKISFAYQAMLGGSYIIKNNIEVDAGYRYLNYGKVEDVLGIKAKANVYSIGMKVRF